MCRDERSDSPTNPAFDLHLGSADATELAPPRMSGISVADAHAFGWLLYAALVRWRDATAPRNVVSDHDLEHAVCEVRDEAIMGGWTIRAPGAADASQAVHGASSQQIPTRLPLDTLTVIRGLLTSPEADDLSPADRIAMAVDFIDEFDVEADPVGSLSARMRRCARHHERDAEALVRGLHDRRTRRG